MYLLQSFKLLKSLPPNVNFVRLFYNETEPTIHRTSKGPGQLAKMVLSYKNYRWLYEREWRMFAPLGKAHYEDAASVTRVYLGSRINLGGHPNPAIEGHLKTGHRETA
jgi:hypothetical protein